MMYSSISAIRRAEAEHDEHEQDRPQPGNVILQKMRHSLAPSTRADSYSSFGIVERPAR